LTKNPALSRAQIGGAPTGIPWQTTCDLAFSFWIETGSYYGVWIDIVDFHDRTTGVNCGPTHVIDPATGKFFVWRYLTGTSTYINNWPPRSSAACPQGQWHHVRTTFRLDNAPNGFCYSWFDGVQILNYSGALFGNTNGAPSYQHWALYGGNAGTTPMRPAAVWLANCEFDVTGTQPFSSRVRSPLPVPPLI
jgi:hypothetical protein